ncbi:hypothetical protein [Hymenobacter crusticola]|uniref:Uncharacterized protein n=1 Tax=Hymenobacter crusticola TaxID=1770526 RepID=A0A243WKA6_9BACT|nr:hypothetical protein [Hymenobacter crusticola]OUJ76029.1 hypothetical protein BXP70_01765 [Hymenobacter crusticola]
MKKTLSIFLLAAGLSISCVKQAAAQTTAADTTGEHRMIQDISADLCRQIEEESKKAPLTNLSQEEATQLFARLMLVSAGNNATFTKLILTHKSDANAYGGQLGKRIAFRMVKECPASVPLFMKVGYQELRKQHPMSEQEVKVLTPVAAGVCQGIEARQKKQDLAAMSAQERMQVVEEVMQAAMKPHAKALSQLYGADLFLDQKKMEQVGVKIAVLMGDQCPAILTFFATAGQSAQPAK